MEIAIDIFRVVHVVSAILMAWPFYALVAVNQRARLGPPLCDRVDTYMENIIRNRVIPCYVFQATVFITGIVLLYLRGLGLRALWTYPILGLKFLLLMVIAGLLTFVYRNLQPKIDELFVKGGNPVSPDIASKISALRLKRKRLAASCLFLVLVEATLGVQAWLPFPTWLTVVLIISLAAFTWRAYNSVTPYGWA